MRKYDNFCSNLAVLYIEMFCRQNAGRKAAGIDEVFAFGGSAYGG